MALQADIEWKGITVPQAYIRVEPSALGKTMLGFRLVTLASPDAEEPFASEDRSCAYDLDGENPWKQAYAYLKTLPEFKVGGVPASYLMCRNRHGVRFDVTTYESRWIRGPASVDTHPEGHDREAGRGS